MTGIDSNNILCRRQALKMRQQNHVVGQSQLVSNLYHLLDFSWVRNEALALLIFESSAPVSNRRFFWEKEDVGRNLDGMKLLRYFEMDGCKHRSTSGQQT
jgi:hypothetical protein